MARGGFMNDFLFGFAGGIAKSAIDSFGEDTDLGIGLNKGTANRFKEHADDRLETVRKSYFDHIEKLDLAQRQAKDLMSLIGEVDEAGLATNLSASEAAARIMRNKTTTEIDEYIKTFRSQRTNEGLDIRSHYADFFKRGEQEDAIQYTAKDIAKMQVGAFKYKPQQFNLANNRTGLFNLASGFGLFNQTAQEEQEALDKRQRQRITRNLPRFDEVSQPPTRAEARSVINLPGNLMRSAKSRMDEKLSKLEITKVEEAIKYAAEQRKEQRNAYQDARKNAAALRTIREGQISDAEVQRRDANAKRAFDGSELIVNAGDALNRYNESPTPENAEEVRKTSRLVTQHQLRVNAYKNASDQVADNLAANPLYSTKKTNSGMSDLTKPITDEQRSQIRDAEWKKVFTKTVSTLDENNISLVNPDMFGLNINPEWVQNELDYIRIGKVGTRISGTSGTERETLTAGVRALDSNLSDEDVNERVASLMAHKSASRNQATQVKSTTGQNKDDKDEKDEKKKPLSTPKRLVTQEQYDADKKEIARLENKLKRAREAMARYPADTPKIQQRNLARKNLIEVSEELRERKKKLENSEVPVSDII